MSRRVRVVLLGVAAILLLGSLAIGGWIVHNLGALERDMAAVREAGFVEKTVTIDGVTIHYGEGPDHGPPLLLLHGQASDWKSYARVLPALAEHYHVLAPDIHGHGGTDRTPDKYSAGAIGRDLAAFIREVIGQPAVVAGHSSGGLLAVWLAANEPELVRAVILEDPPLFTTLFPRAEQTWNYVDLATTTHRFLQSGESDFVVYAIEHGKFFSLFGGLRDRMIESAEAQRAEDPAQPISFWYMPAVMNDLLRSMERYDPRFGQTFYDGSWNEGLGDHAQALSRIHAPTELLHANWIVDDEGILRGAMDDQDARRARDALPNVRFHRVDSGHGIHLEEPEAFVEIVMAAR